MSRPRVAHALLLAVTLVGGCGAPSPSATSSTPLPVPTVTDPLAHRAHDLPPDKLTPLGTTVKAGAWGVIAAPALTADISGVPKGTVSHNAVRIAQVHRGRPGLFKQGDVQLTDGFDVERATPYYIDVEWATLSGWNLDDHTPHVDLAAKAGDGEIVSIVDNGVKYPCQLEKPQPGFWSGYGIERHRCQLVLGSGTARPTRFVASGVDGAVYFALPTPTG